MDTRVDGCLGVGNCDDDFLLNSETQLPILVTQDNIYYSYNQNKYPEWRHDCTLFGSFTSLGAQMNKRYRDSDIWRIVNKSREEGKLQDKGRYTKQGVDLVKRDRNINNPNDTVSYYFTEIGSKLYYEAINKGYFVVCSIRGNYDLALEQSKGVITSKKVPGTPTYGHVLSNSKGIYNGKDTIRWIDNYNRNTETYEPNPRYNESVLAFPDEQIKSNIYQLGCYIFVPDKSKEEEIKRLTEFKNIVEKDIEENGKSWRQKESMKSLTNDNVYKAWLTKTQTSLNKMNDANREKLKDIDEQLRIYSH